MKCPFPALGGRLIGPYACCGKPVWRERIGLCSGHYQQRLRGQALRPLTPQQPPGPCTFAGCRKPRFAARLCTGHYQQERAGKPLAPLRPRSGGRKASASRA